MTSRCSSSEIEMVPMATEERKMRKPLMAKNKMKMMELEKMVWRKERGRKVLNRERKAMKREKE